MESSKTMAQLSRDELRKSETSWVKVLAPEKIQWSLYVLALIFNDLLMMGFAFRLAYFIRFNLSVPIFQTDVVPNLQYYQLVTFFIAIFWWVIFVFLGLYNKEQLLGGPQEYALVFRATSIAILLVIIFDFLQPMFLIARGWLILAWSLSFIFIGSGRFWLRRIIYYLRRYWICRLAICRASKREYQ